ncbi:MAG: serine/threonine-protein kinase [Myxococcota bacterium]
MRTPNQQDFDGPSEAAPTLPGVPLTDADEEVSPPPRRTASFMRGQTVGRYVVLSRLGVGGMGVVYVAYDPELDRRVALKLLHPAVTRSSPASTERAQRRLLREAQALAKLDHPNVVSVHDVGEYEGGVYIAMDFVEGVTLGAWAREEQRPQRELIEMYLHAGRGLAEAHKKGIVHRDFKPDNVMVGEDGRVRVLDFGLARPTGSGIDHETIPEDIELAVPSNDALENPLTEVGSVLGTPAYMAPEQHLREEAGAAADQFAFCVALWEAVYGKHPYGASSRVQLAMIVVQGDIQVSTASKGPRWLRRALMRGLSAKPTDRHPSMADLLLTIEAGIGHGRRRPLLLASATLGALAVGAVGFHQYHKQQQVSECETLGAAITEQWSEDTEAQARRAMLDTGLVYAPDAVVNALPRITRWASSWQDHRTDLCMATEIEERFDPELAERAVECLETHRLHLPLLATRLQNPDEKAVSEAVASAARLPQLESCLDPRYLRLRPSHPPEAREAVLSVHERIARSMDLHAVSDFSAAEGAARQALDLAEQLGEPALISAARTQVGTIQLEQGLYEEAERTFIQAFSEAGVADALETAATASASLAYVVGYRRSRHGEGLAWAKIAEVYARKLEPDDGPRTANLANQVAAIYLNKGDHDKARENFERARRLREETFGKDHPQVASMLGNLAASANAEGDLPGAIELQTEALERLEYAYGANHPLVAAALSNLGLFHHRMGNADEAKAALERSLALYEASVDPEHPQIATALNNLALVYQGLGELDTAEAQHRRALKIRRAALGPEHPQMAITLMNLSFIADGRGNYTEARSVGKRGADMLEKLLGAEHPHTLKAFSHLGSIAASLGEYDEAMKFYERVLDSMTQRHGPTHESLAGPLSRIGQLALERGDRRQARQRLERALSLQQGTERLEGSAANRIAQGLALVYLEEGDTEAALSHAERGLALVAKGDDSPEEVAKSHFVAAQVLWELEADAGGARPRALRLARDARETYQKVPEAKASKDRAAVEAWLREREPA